MSKGFSEDVMDLARAQEANTPEAKEKREQLRDAYLAGEERKFQRDAESWLQLRGWFPRTQDFIARGKPRVGWYVHLHEAKRNPIILDLLLLANNGRHLEVELKTSDGKLTMEQAMLVKCGGKVVRSLAQLISVIREWEGQ